MTYKWGILTTYKSWDDAPSIPFKRCAFSGEPCVEKLWEDRSGTPLHPKGFLGFTNRWHQDHTFWSEIALLLDVVGKTWSMGG